MNQPFPMQRAAGKREEDFVLLILRLTAEFASGCSLVTAAVAATRRVWTEWPGIPALAYALINRLARGADRIPIGISHRGPDFSAKRHHWTAFDGGFGDSILAHIVGVAILIPRLTFLAGTF